MVDNHSGQQGLLMSFSRRDFIQTVLMWGAAMAVRIRGSASGSRAKDSPGPELWYRQPAAEWNEALPVGNGRLGAMIFGRPGEERIQLNVDSLWAGSPLERERRVNPGDLEQARELWFSGDVVEAQRIMQEKFMSERLIRSHQTLGDLFIENGPVPSLADYRRSLDLRDGIAGCVWSADGSESRREVFATAVHDALRLNGLALTEPLRLEQHRVVPGTP